MKQLTHNGILIPSYEPKGLSLVFRGERIHLPPEGEEMAVAFARQLGTDRAEDPVFVRNFIGDFARALGVDRDARLEDFDFSEIRRMIGEEKIKKESMTPVERKAIAEARKGIREANREKYGYAIVDGEKVETNYAVEPPCIFIGKGKHPLRGRWKPRVGYRDIELILSPDAPTPPTPDGSEWGGRTFDPYALWVARWRCKLTGKMKYVWLAETAPSKQRREIRKFNLARRLKQHIGRVQRVIKEGLNSENPLERQVATAAYLIDELKLRVGDEKDPDELDTCGVTTLDRSNVKIRDLGKVEFDFLGKGAVRFHRTVGLPPVVVRNLESFLFHPQNGRIFPELRSEQVNALLGRAMRGLTSKVFRTHYASEAVRKTLKKFKVYPGGPDFKKLYVARRANLEAARVLNHRKKIPKNWCERVEKQRSRVEALKAKLEEIEEKPSARARRRQVKGVRKRLWEAKLKLKLMRKTRGWNFGTSLRSYIDPRIYAGWAERVSYDWRKIYPKALQRKFAWAASKS